MAIVNPSTLKVGQVVKFTCDHPTDISTYQGTIVGISNYSIVKMLETDLIPYHSEVAKRRPSIKPITELSFITLEYVQNELVHRVSRAMEWIQESSVVVLESGHRFDIRIYDRDSSEATDIIQLLESHGYIASLVESSIV